MILFLHNRYRVTGGEERAVADLAWLVREHLVEPVELLERDSGTTTSRAAARALLRGGEDPEEIGAAVRRTGARIVHAHNLNPSFGPRALAAARAAGAKVVLHLHNYRLVCAVGTCVDPAGKDCTRCHGRNTTPGLVRNCRGSRPEALVYAAALARHSASLVAQADAIIVPSTAARDRLRTLGAPLGGVPVHVVGHVVRALEEQTPRNPRRSGGQGSENVSLSERNLERRDAVDAAGLPSPPALDGPALVVSRLAPEKAVDLAIRAAILAEVPLVIAGDGPGRARLEGLAHGHDVRFVGRVDATELAALRTNASVALAPTRAHETFGLAALEAMAAGVPTVAVARGALVDLAPGAELVPPEDPKAMAAALLRLRGDALAGERARERAEELAAPSRIAPALAAVYAGL